MTVPASGSLQLAKLRNEFQNGNYLSAYTLNATSLEDLSTGQYGTSYGGPDGSINVANLNANKPDGDTPHSMSEFYKYDDDGAVNSSPLSFGPVSYGGQSSNSTITVSHAVYSTWYVSSKPSWVNITSGNYGSGNKDTGSGSVTFTVQSNSGSARQGDIVVTYDVGTTAGSHPSGPNSTTTRISVVSQSGAPSGPPGVPPGGGGNGRGFNP
tara:strand:+ start:214 stop:846 length:633 start_codon:yes stop_codon:yes gene_type:complete